MYTKLDYKTEILEFINTIGYHPTKVIDKTSEIFFLNQNNLEQSLYTKFINIFIMDEGPEYEMNENEFKEFINEL